MLQIGLTFLTFWILLSYLVPISLFVTLEIVKFWQVGAPQLFVLAQAWHRCSGFVLAHVGGAGAHNAHPCVCLESCCG